VQKPPGRPKNLLYTSIPVRFVADFTKSHRFQPLNGSSFLSQTSEDISARGFRPGLVLIGYGLVCLFSFYVAVRFDARFWGFKGRLSGPIDKWKHKSSMGCAVPRAREFFYPRWMESNFPQPTPSHTLASICASGTTAVFFKAKGLV